MFLFFFWEGSTPLRLRSFFFEIGARWRWPTQEKYHRVFLQPCPRPFFPRLPFRFFLSISFFLSPFPHHTCSLIISPFFQNLHSSHLPPRHSLLRCGPRTPYTRACIFFLHIFAPVFFRRSCRVTYFSSSPHPSLHPYLRSLSVSLYFPRFGLSLPCLAHTPILPSLLVDHPLALRCRINWYLESRLKACLSFSSYLYYCMPLLA
ncbi:hypothetical protein B0H13DRAFT_805576 [Mycena leptocephala]|nr:hypothetical protein B0H13DRAFT_805576 [Mycena leptocephala]